jgi:hypothetical protein
VRRESDAIWHWLGVANTAPDWHQQEEAKVEQGAELRHALTDW